MTRIFNTTSLSVLFAILFLVSASHVEAGKSVTVTNNNIPVLSYYWNRAAVYSTDTVTLETSATEDCRRIVDRGGNVNLVCGWVKGLERGSNASILYKGKLVNVDTNREITDRTQKEPFPNSSNTSTITSMGCFARCALWMRNRLSGKSEGRGKSREARD